MLYGPASILSVFLAQVVFLRLVVPATLLADLFSVYSCTWECEWLFQRDFKREKSGQGSLLLDGNFIVLLPFQ